MTSPIREKQLSSLDPPVLVTDGNERAALAVTRALGQVGIPVIVAAETESSLAGASRYCTDKWKYPSPLSDPSSFIESIKSAIQVNGVSSVFSISDSTTQLLARVKGELGLAGAAIPSWDAYDFVSDKYRLMELAQQLNVPTPGTIFVPDGNVNAVAEQITQYPVVVKPGRSLTQVDGKWTKTSVHVLSSRNELMELYKRTPYLSSPSLIQRRIEGTGQGIFGLFDQGKSLALFAHRRIREKPPAGGVSVFRESIALPEPMTSYAVRLLEQVKWQGVAMVEFKVDRESGVPMLMEINGRFWGSLQLAIDAGLNLPHLLHQMVNGISEVVPRDSYRVGTKSRWLLGDLDHLLLRLTRSKESLDLPRTAESRWRCLRNFCKLSVSNLHYEIERRDDLGPAKLEYRAWLTEVTGARIWDVLRPMKKGLGCLSAPIRAVRRLYHRWTTRVPGTVTSVLFVCQGNICRSPFAEMYFQSLLKGRGMGLTVRSAGLGTTPGKPAHWNTRTSAREHHVSLDDHATAQLDADLVNKSDLIVVMEVSQKKRVLSLYPQSKRKVVLLGCFDAKGPLEIADPYGRPIEHFRTCFSQIVRCCDSLAGELASASRSMVPPPRPAPSFQEPMSSHVPKQTILHLSTTSGPGGAERVISSLSASLNTGQRRVMVGLFRPGWLQTECERLGVKTIIMPLSGPLHLGWFLNCLRLIRRERVMLIHAHEFSAIVYGWIVSRLARIPFIGTIHGKNYFGEKARRRVAYRIIARTATLVAVSEDLKRFVVERIGIPADRIKVIYNGVTPSPPVNDAEVERCQLELGIHADDRVLGTVGSLYPVKGHTFLLDAMPAVLQRFPNTVLIIAGRGELEVPLKDQARRLGIEEKVRFLGMRQDIPRLLGLMDVFVLPSLSEGLSIALLEAMAAGKPVVTTRVGGNPELVEEGKTGMLVLAEDAEELAASLLKMLEEPTNMHSLGRTGAIRVQQEFSTHRMSRRYADLYSASLSTIA